MNQKILQLHGTVLRHIRCKQRFIERPVTRKQFFAHEHRANEVVDKRRVYPVTTKIPDTGEAIAQLPDTSVQNSAEPHDHYFLSIPAKRPVEKAI